MSSSGTSAEDEKRSSARSWLSGSLPIWPVALLLLGTPAWWLLGIGLFIWPLMGAVMGVYLLIGGGVRFPVAFGLWLGFVAWMLLSALMLESGEGAKFAGNAVLYLSATVLFLYAYRVAADPAMRRRLVLVGAGFWAIVALGGWFALAFPDFSVTTPVQRLMPGLEEENEFVAQRVTADAAVEGWVGTRPRAPFGEVNEWGANFGLSLPFALLSLGLLRRRWQRAALAALLVASIVPAVESQNRGLWIVLAAVGLYALIRFAWPPLRRLPLPRLAVIGAASLAGLLALALSPIGERVIDRATTRGGGDTARSETYRAALELAAERPVLGYATTQETEVAAYPAGTHGHGYRLLVSHGVGGFLLFAGWFLAVAWGTRRGPPDAICAHLVVLVGVLAMAFYNLLPGQLHLMMLAAAIGLAAVGGSRAGPGISGRRPGASHAGAA